jgi:hypothetical protein
LYICCSLAQALLYGETVHANQNNQIDSSIEL